MKENDSFFLPSKNEMYPNLCTVIDRMGDTHILRYQILRNSYFERIYMERNYIEQYLLRKESTSNAYTSNFFTSNSIYFEWKLDRLLYCSSNFTFGNYLHGLLNLLSQITLQCLMPIIIVTSLQCTGSPIRFYQIRNLQQMYVLYTP